MMIEERVSVSRKRKRPQLLKLSVSILLIIILIINIAVICMGESAGSGILGRQPVAIIPVLSDSMNPVLKAGDAILTVNTDFSDIRTGDVVVYCRDGDLVVHQVIDRDDTQLITKGLSNESVDLPVTEDEYRTKMAFRIPLLGGIWRITSKPFNFLLFALLVTLLIFGDHIFERIYNGITGNKDETKD